jgi:hypothetical protein
MSPAAAIVGSGGGFVVVGRAIVAGTVVAGTVVRGTVVVVAGTVVVGTVVVDAAVGRDAEDGDAPGVLWVQAVMASEPTTAPAITNLLARITPFSFRMTGPSLIAIVPSRRSTFKAGTLRRDAPRFCGRAP